MSELTPWWMNEKIYDFLGRVVFPLACRVTALVLFALEIRGAAEPSAAALGSCVLLLGLPWLAALRRNGGAS